MLRMLHQTSGRNNFKVIKPENKDESASSQKPVSDDQQKKIEEQTNAAIQNASQPNDNTDSK